MKHLNSFWLKTSLLFALVLSISFSAKADYDYERDGVYYVFTYYDEDLDDYYYYEGPHDGFPQDGYGNWMFGDPNNSTVAVTHGDTQYSGSVEIASQIYINWLWAFTANVTSIGSEAFRNCSSLTSVYIPSSIESIGDYAFLWCTNLKNVTIPNSVSYIGAYAFARCESFTRINIPSSVTTIDEHAFDVCSKVTSITIPSSVTSIGAYAFAHNPSLTTVSIPSSVKTLPSGIFYQCTSLASVNIPNSVTSIGSAAFYDCPSLRSITCRAMTPPSISYSSFTTDQYSNATLYVPADAIESYKAASYWSNFANIDRIPGTGIDINATNFPDANFRSYMLSLYPKGYLTTSDINGLTSLNIANRNISNLKGLELFTELKELRCWNNSFTTLNLSSNTKLTYLDCAPNSTLTSLNVASCTNLERLYCYNTSITSLSLNNCTNLKTLRCYGTKLTSLYVYNKSQLTEININNTPTLNTLVCYRDALTYLDVSGCTGLNELKCYENDNLAAVTGLADCTAITYLDCEDCAITDLSAVNSMTNITNLLARNNKITSLSLNSKSSLKYVRINGNVNLKAFYCSSNSQLSEIYMMNCSALETAWMCQDNLSSLNVSGCTSLRDLAIWQNHISGEAMTNLISTLPTVTGNTPGQLAVLDDVNEYNTITDEQVLAANRKNWVCKRWTNGHWEVIVVNKPGDVDGDGKVSIDDVTALIDILLSGSSAATAVVDGNGSVNIDDLTYLIDMLLNGN